MNDSKKEDFKMWMRAQPDYCSYTRVRSFLTDLLSVNKAKAEVEMAQMQKYGDIKIIERKSGSSGRRVFLEPLEELDESHIRAVWNGSEHVSKDINKIALAVHDMTGHEVSDIKEFMAELETAVVKDGDSFRWLGEQEYGDEEEYIR